MKNDPKVEASRPELESKQNPTCAASRKRSKRSGFSFVEMLVVLGVLSSLVSIALYSVSNISGTSRIQKLKADVASLNSAVRVYLANGGSLEGLRSEKEVLVKLKTEGSNAKELVGLKDAMIDPALDVEMANARKRGEWRAQWDANRQRFVLATSGRGVKEFTINEDLAEGNVATEERKSNLKYAKRDTWVWDYQDRSLSTDPTLNTAPETPGGGGPTTPPSSRPLRLNPPEFTIRGGTYGIVDFPLPVGLINPNGQAKSVIYYTVDGTSWKQLTDKTITVQADTEVKAYVASRDPEKWLDSIKASQLYATSPEAAEVSVSFSKPAYNYMELGGAMLPGIYEPVLAEPGLLTIQNLNRIPNEAKSGLTVDVTGSKFMVAGNMVEGSTASLLDLLKDDAVSKNPGLAENEAELMAHLTTVKRLELQLPVGMEDYGDSDSVSVSAMVRSSVTSVLDSNVANAELGSDAMQLHPPVIVEKERPDGLFEFGVHYVEMNLETSLGDMPEGSRIYYTVDGSDPGSGAEPDAPAARLYEQPVLVAQPSNVPVRARVYGPDGKEGWFETSAAAELQWPAPTDIAFAMTVSTSDPGDSVASAAAAEFFSKLSSEVTGGLVLGALSGESSGTSAPADSETAVE